MSNDLNRKLTAIVPAKATSSRVPYKNIQKINKMSLIEIKVRQLLKCPSIYRVFVGSDCAEILQLATDLGAEVVLRDQYHCDESRCSANDMIADLVNRVDGYDILWAHCTNPFVGAQDYEDAYKTYLSKIFSGFDSLCSVSRIQSHIWTREFTPLNFLPLRNPHQLAKEVAPLYSQDGAIFIQPREKMVENRYFYGAKPFLYELEQFRGFDINTIDDLKVARCLSSIYLRDDFKAR